MKNFKSVEQKDRIDLSIVMASVNGLPIIDECLERLVNQAVTYKVEIVVADRCGINVTELINKKYPEVKLVQTSSEKSIPHLRAMAIERASGRVIGVIEDHCLVETDWAQRMIEAHQGRYAVIGGAIENAACNKLSDWASFFCEYSQAMKPMPEGEVDSLPGNNVSYKRWVLERFQQNIDSGIWDFLLHEHIKQENISLYSIPSIAVSHKMSATLIWFIVQKFHLARSYAGMRFADSIWPRRVLYGAGAVLLPLVLLKRIVLCILRKRRRRRELFLSLPFLVLLLISWALGEAMGYFFGAGSSSVKVA